MTAVDLGADGVGGRADRARAGRGPAAPQRAVRRAAGARPGVRGSTEVALATVSTRTRPPNTLARPPARVGLAHGPRTVVVAGDDAGPPARVLAEQGRWPLLAEPTSGSRTGDAALRCYRLLLDGPLADEVERVVVLGHPTLSRPVTRLLNRPDVEVLSVATPGVWSERPFPVTQHLEGRPVAAAPDDSDWFDRWQAADADVARRLDALLAAEADLTPWEVAGAVARALPAGGLLVVGASSPIRDLDLMVRALRGRRTAQGDRQPRALRDRRHGVDGGRRRPRPRLDAVVRADGRRDVPARRQRAGASRPRPRARPDHRGRQRRRRLDLRHPRAGRTRARRPLRPALRDAPRRRPRRACAPRPAPRTGGSSRCPSSSRRWRLPTAASRWWRCGSAATTGASSTPASARLAQR